MLGVLKHRTVYRILKSERINSLRKQYDAFLEEDKKRKERNEYILGRLDKMRYSAALIPVRDKNITHINRTNLDLQIPMNKQQILQNNLQTRVVEDSYIIQEISKNYILIPKLRSTFTNPYIQQIIPVNEEVKVRDVQNIQENPNDTGDTQSSAIDNNWQSKYEILNILKKEEKEKEANVNPSDKYIPGILLNNEIPVSKKAYANRDNLTKNINGNLGNKHRHEVPEKDVPLKKDYVIDSHNSKDDNHETVQIHAIHENTAPTEFSVTPSDIVDDIEYNLQNTNLEDGDSKISILRDEITSYAEHDAVLNDDNHISSVEPIYYEEQLEPVYNKQEIDGKQSNEINKQKHLQNSNNDCTAEPQPPVFLKLESTNEIIDEQTENTIQVINPLDVMEQIDPLNAQDVNIIPNVTDASNSEFNDELSCMPGIEDEEPPIEPVYEVTNTAVDQEHVDETDIQAFDAEQREMFYMEQPAESYNIHDDVNVNEQQYSQNEVQDQNQEYSYYENTQPEAYPVNLDVNEEQTLRYDPTYQQQYVESYEKAYEQQPQQYEVEQNDQINSEQIEHVYAEESMETPEGIETTLNNEEGYIEQQQNDDNLVNLPDPSETENRQT